MTCKYYFLTEISSQENGYVHDSNTCDARQCVCAEERYLRLRQMMFLLKDKIKKESESTITQISSGSLAEGVHFLDSDVDIMHVINNVHIIQNMQGKDLTLRETILKMEYDHHYPGFSKLKLIAIGKKVNYIEDDGFVVSSDNDGIFLSSSRFRQNLLQSMSALNFTNHGPCISDPDQDYDFAFCLRSRRWPKQAEKWIYRHRYGEWPTDTLIRNIIKRGCLLVPIGPRRCQEDDELLWRVSFSEAEKELCHSFNYTQMICYRLLKCSLQLINLHEKDLLCSYFLKTAVFWVSEEISIDSFKITNMKQCFSLCIEKLITWVDCCYCPNYFIPENNMFRGKVNKSNNTSLLELMRNIKRNGPPIMNDKFQLSPSIYTDTKLECLFFRITNIGTSIESPRAGLKIISFLISFRDSCPSVFLKEVCKYYISNICQCLVQMLSISKCNKQINVRMFQKLLQKSLKTDAVSGWLLYASFFYVLGRYEVTLCIVDYILSRCTPDMFQLGSTYCEWEEHMYEKLVSKQLYLGKKMKIATIDIVVYIKMSILIPYELRQEVMKNELLVLPDVMSYCLRFLCYHHLNEIDMRNEALYDLEMTAEGNVFDNTKSTSFTISGICNEIAGRKTNALHWYEKSLQCRGTLCSSAIQRLRNLTSD